MVNQVNFDFQVKEPELALLNNKFHVKMKKLGIPYTIKHIERALNKAADRLANDAITKKIIDLFIIFFILAYKLF